MLRRALPLGLWLFVVGHLYSAPFAHWTAVNPLLPLGTWLRTVAYGNGVYVAAGSGIVVSTNGTAWTLVDGVAGGSAVVFADGKFVVVGSQNAGVSTNGVDWTVATVPKTDFEWITYGAGLFAAETIYIEPGNVFDPLPHVFHTIMTSPDGLHWKWAWGVWDMERRVSWGKIAYGNGTFVASAGGAEVISHDGILWKIPDQPCCAPGGVIFGNGVFVAQQNGTIVTSLDGLSWTEQYAAAPSGFGFARGIFGAVGDGGAILTSPDGTNWTQHASGSIGSLFAFTGGDQGFVAVGMEAEIVESPDGEHWTSRGTLTSTGLSGVAFDGHTFVALGGNYYNRVWQPDTVVTSNDGRSWQVSSSGRRHYLTDLAWAQGKFVAVGLQFPTDPTNMSNGAILTSTNGLNWTDPPAVPATDLRAVTFGNGQFMAVGSGILTSTDGVEWTPQNVAALGLSGVGPISSVAYGNGLFMITVLTNILTSPDGISWTKRASIDGLGNSSHAISFGAGRFAVVGQRRTNALSAHGAMWTSSDGDVWTVAGEISGPTLGHVSFGNGVFLGFGSSYTLAVHIPGQAWITVPQAPAALLSAFAYGEGTFIGVGGGGAILRSDNFVQGILNGHSRDPGHFEVQMFGELGRDYRLQVSDELRPVTWTDRLSFTASTPLTNFIDSVDGSHRFYRLAAP